MAEAAAEKRFLALLVRIFSDGVLSDEESAELDSFEAKGEVPPERTNEIVVHYLEKRFAQFVADGRIEDWERARLRVVLDTFHLPDDAVPEAIRRAAGR